jgi:hypothetical protein
VLQYRLDYWCPRSFIRHGFWSPSIPPSFLPLCSQYCFPILVPFHPTQLPATLFSILPSSSCLSVSYNCGAFQYSLVHFREKCGSPSCYLVSQFIAVFHFLFIRPFQNFPTTSSFLICHAVLPYLEFSIPGFLSRIVRV